MCHYLPILCCGVSKFLKTFSKSLCEMAPAFYAVRKGRLPGIYKTWDECKQQVDGFPCASFKKFKTEREAISFVKECNSLSVSSVNKNSFPSPSLKRKRDSLDANDLFDDVALNSMDIDSVIAAFASSEPEDTQKSLIFPSTARKKAFYAVHRGHKPGLYFTWTECERQIKDFRNASYRKFETKEAALEYIKTGGVKKLSRREAKTVEINRDFAYSSHDEGKEISVNDLKVDPDRVITIFTDGASSNNGRVGAAAGIGVFWGPNHPLNTSMRLPGRQTNNRAEIYAATHALRQAKQVGYKHIKLYTDSQFLIRGITDWINKWKKNGWKLANGEPVKNKFDFIELEKAKEGLNVEFIYIKAHNNNPGNVEADRLAVEGARKNPDDAFAYLI